MTKDYFRRIENYEATRARRDGLHADWNLVTGAPSNRKTQFFSTQSRIHAARSAMASDAGDFGFEEIGVRGVDTYIMTRHRQLR
jgi:hypothetical protein